NMKGLRAGRGRGGVGRFGTVLVERRARIGRENFTMSIKFPTKVATKVRAGLAGGAGRYRAGSFSSARLRSRDRRRRFPRNGLGSRRDRGREGRGRRGSSGVWI